MHQHKATRTISVFSHAAFEARLPKQGALLVASNTTNWNARAQDIYIRLAKNAARRLDFG
jgi:hypothetical protein